ncbi:uncharacterized protein LOC110686964 isoform X3 [Chenopodium quinoa]|uniref:uncharacterized protein LOC110686964 isoform X3 n=1 Tax=Chenopodium quinoa TaxID=63459 RepID=UPI000B790B78|nr:uncharacterized protein LOC110686964 isoform X3 [Chenopodium quinoa]
MGRKSTPKQDHRRRLPLLPVPPCFLTSVFSSTVAGFLLCPSLLLFLFFFPSPPPGPPSSPPLLFRSTPLVVMAGGGRRKLGHATPRELFPSISHANTETSPEATPSPQPLVDGSGTSTQFPQTQDSNSPMGEVPTPVARRTLHPTGLWFDDNTVSTSITNIFQAHWREPWLNYEMVDEVTKTHWWNSFTKLYLWNDDLDALVKKEYEKKAHKRLKEITYNVSIRNKSVPRWMG